MKRGNLELMVGIFVLAGLACLAYLAVHLGKMEIYGGGYRLTADFDSVSGLKVGASVEVAGVHAGRVESISLTPGYQARVVLNLFPTVKVHQDAIASIRTKGIIGEQFVKLSVGGAEAVLPPGGKIRETESGFNLEELIGLYMHGKV